MSAVNSLANQKLRARFRASTLDIGILSQRKLVTKSYHLRLDLRIIKMADGIDRKAEGNPNLLQYS